MSTNIIEPSNPEGILQRLPAPDYAVNFQPTFPDNDLREAIGELQATETVTTPESCLALKKQLSTPGVVVVTAGSCHESVELTTPIRELAQRVERTQELVLASPLGKSALTIHRSCGQNTKPRSSEFEQTNDGSTVHSHMGDAVNGAPLHLRTPAAFRMVAAAVQARDLSRTLEARNNLHWPTAHEAILLAYEHSFVRASHHGNFLLSADNPWIGLRTNHPEGPHVQLLSNVENPVGVKIGPGNNEDTIKGLTAKLNPLDEPGKLIFMIRFALEQAEETETVLRAIKRFAPKSLLQYDIHGSTVTNTRGQKIRAVQRIIGGIEQLAQLTEQHQLNLNGVHLETTTDDDRLECVETIDDQPRDPGNVDPRLNPEQTARVLAAVAHYIGN